MRGGGGDTFQGFAKAEIFLYSIFKLRPGLEKARARAVPELSKFWNLHFFNVFERRLNISLRRRLKIISGFEVGKYIRNYFKHDCKVTQ